MKVLIIGLPLFAKNLAKELNQFDPDNRYVCLNTYYRFIDKLKFLYHVRNCDIVYSLNGSIYNARAFDMALKFKKKLIIHWVGTDVIKAKKSYGDRLIKKIGDKQNAPLIAHSKQREPFISIMGKIDGSILEPVVSIWRS